jgi:hypothetical protein
LPLFPSGTHNADVNVAPLAAKRNLLGVMALICLASAVCLWVFAADPENNALLSVVTRVGIVLGALWLALPSVGTNWAWRKAGPVLIIAIVLTALAGRRLRYALPVAIVVAVLLVILRPRPKRNNVGRS